MAWWLGVWLIVLAARGVVIRVAQLLGVPGSALDNGPSFQYRSPLLVLWVFAPLTWDVALCELWFLFLIGGVILIRAGRREASAIRDSKEGAARKAFELAPWVWLGFIVWLLIMGLRGALIAFTRYEMDFRPLEILAPDGLTYVFYWLWPAFVIGGLGGLAFWCRRHVGRSSMKKGVMS